MRELLLWLLLITPAFAQTAQPDLFGDGVPAAGQAQKIGTRYINLRTADFYVCTATATSLGVTTCTWTKMNSAGGGTWGSITGTLASQTDLQNALNLLAPLASPVFTGQPTISDFTLAGHNHSSTATGGNIPEGSVTNLTSDLALKSTLASPTFTGVPAGPTAALSTNTTQLSTTAFVLNQAAAPGVIGGTTPAAGHFTTLDATTSIGVISDGVHAGILSTIGNTTAPSIPSNSFGFIGPNSASFTSWFIQPSSTAPTAGCIPFLGAPSTNVSAMSCLAAFNFVSPTLSIGAVGAGTPTISLLGTTSGTASIAGPAVAGTITNPFTLTNSLQLPSGTNYILNGMFISATSGTAVSFGNAAAGNNARVSAAAYTSAGTKFSASGCANSTTVGGASAGSYVSVTGGACSVTITMGSAATAPNGWSCWANDITTAADAGNVHQTGGSTTTAILTEGTVVANDVINFGCMAF